MSHTPLRDLPADKFPLRFEEYSNLYDRLREAASGFANLGYPALAEEVDATRAQLHKAWNAIRDTESAGL